MDSSYKIGDYLEVNQEAVMISAIKEGALYHDDICLISHCNIILNDRVFRACGFKKLEDDWVFREESGLWIRCQKEQSGTYRVIVTSPEIPRKEESDFFVLSVLQDYIRDSCGIELPICETALTQVLKAKD